MTGISKPSWRRQDHVYRLRPSNGLSGLNVTSDRSRPAWRDIPIVTGEPSHTEITTRIRLPEEGRRLTLEGDPAVDLTIGGRRYVRKSHLDGGALTIVEQATNTGAEMAASDLPAARVSFAAAETKTLRVQTPPDFTPPFLQSEASRKAGRLDRLTALYAAFIAVKPDDPRRYRSRAAFYEASFQRQAALSDLDKAIALDGDAPTYLARGRLLEAMGETAKATADYKAALAIDPINRAALTRLGFLEIDAGRKAAALAPVDARLVTADEDKADWLIVKAELLSRAGDAGAALETIDAALAIKPGAAALFNQRCWIKGTLGVQLETALADCTRAVELADTQGAELDSRAMVEFRLGQMEAAVKDLDAAVDRNPSSSGSLYLRAVIERRMGRTSQADADAAAARLLDPRIDAQYARWKITA